MKLRWAPRHKKRVPLRFWDPADSRQHDAFTIDISLSGMFIATRAPLAAQTRFRLEILEPRHNYVLYGEVIRAARVAPELQRLQPSGMGVRLVATEELVGELLPPEARAAGRASAPPPAAPAAPARPAAAAAPGRYAMTGGKPPPAAADEPDDGPATYLVRFASPEVFLDVFRRHHQEGGFFVPTRKPAAVGELIDVTLELIGSDENPLRLAGRVAAQVSADGPDGDPVASGMRVELADPEQALAALGQVIRRLRSG